MHREVFFLKQHLVETQIPPAGGPSSQGRFDEALEKDFARVRGGSAGPGRAAMCRAVGLQCPQMPLRLRSSLPFLHEFVGDVYQGPKEAITTAQIWPGVWHLKGTVPFAP